MCSVLLPTFLKRMTGRCGRRSSEQCLLIGTNASGLAGRGLLPFNLAIHSVQSHMGAPRKISQQAPSLHRQNSNFLEAGPC